MPHPSLPLSPIDKKQRYIGVVTIIKPGGNYMYHLFNKKELRILCKQFVYVKVKFSRYRPGVAHRVGRGIALLFHDRGTRRG